MSEQPLSSIIPAPTNRAFLAGQTGSGKTVLARYMCSFRENVVVFDPKRRISWTGYKLVTSLKALTNLNPKTYRRIIYRPDFYEVKHWLDGDEIQRFFEWIYRRENTTLYVDEVYMVTRGEEMPDFYHGCLTQGRELNIETWSATQRPMNIPQVIMSEAEDAYVFPLKMPQDKQKVSAMCAIHADQIAALRKRQFLYAPQAGETMGPYTLRLNKSQV